MTCTVRTPLPQPANGQRIVPLPAGGIGGGGGSFGGVGDPAAGARLSKTQGIAFETDDVLARRVRIVEAELRGRGLTGLAGELSQIARILDPEDGDHA